MEVRCFHSTVPTTLQTRLDPDWIGAGNPESGKAKHGSESTRLVGKVKDRSRFADLVVLGTGDALCSVSFRVVYPRDGMMLDQGFFLGGLGWDRTVIDDGNSSVRLVAEGPWMRGQYNYSKEDFSGGKQ